MIETTLLKDKGYFPINVIADTLKVHQRTLRIYDDEGILVPGRSGKNRRLYSLNNIEKGKFVIFLTQEKGLNLAGIKVILHLLEDRIGKNKAASDYKEEFLKIEKEVNLKSQKKSKALKVKEEPKAEVTKPRRGRKPKVSARG